METMYLQGIRDALDIMSKPCIKGFADIIMKEPRK